MPPARLSPLIALAFAALAFGAPSSATAVQGPASANLLKTGTASSLRSWQPQHARVSRLRAGARDRGALRVRWNGRGRIFSVAHLPRPVSATRAGAAYAADAWVRGHARRTRVCLRLRELAGRRGVGAAERCAVVGRGWQQLPAFSYRARGGGHKMGVIVYAKGAVGATFDLLQPRLLRSSSFSAATTADGDNLVANGTFANELAGWTGDPGELTVGEGRTPDGSSAANVSIHGNPKGLALRPNVPAVVSTTAATDYSAEAWVKGSRSGRVLCLRLGERSSDSLVASGETCVAANGDWQRLGPFVYTTAGDARELSLTILGRDPEGSESFRVDDVRLTRLPPPVPPPAPHAPSLPPPPSEPAPPPPSPSEPTPPTPPPPPPPPPPAPSPAPPTSRLYADDSPLNQRIPANAAVDAASPTMVAQLVSEVEAKGWPIAAGAWTNSVYYADATTPRFDVALGSPAYSGKSLASVPIPASAQVPGDSDGGLVVIDRSTGCEYDFARAQKSSAGTWSAWFANATPTGGSGIYPFAEAPSAAAFANVAGTIFPEELLGGRIDHALAFTMHNTKAGGPVWPATGSDGWSNVPGAIPEGARLQLDPALDLDSLSLTAWQKTIARALQEYGMYLVDTGGAVALRAQHTMSTSLTYPWGVVDYGQMPKSVARNLRVLQLGPQQPVTYRFVPNACATLR